MQIADALLLDKFSKLWYNKILGLWRLPTARALSPLWESLGRRLYTRTQQKNFINAHKTKHRQLRQKAGDSKNKGRCFTSDQIR